VFDLAGKIAIVAGGCGLIGKEIVSALRQMRCEVYALDTAKEAALPGGIHADVSYFASDLLQKAKPFKIWVNATYPKRWQDHIETYLTVTDKIAGFMADNGGGVIVNVASIYGVVGPCDEIYNQTLMSMPLPYSAVKGGIIALSRAVAPRYASRGVRCNCVSPGGVFDNQHEKFVEAYCKRVPMRRMAYPDDISGIVAFLCSDEASYITGQNLIIDGGLTAW